MEDIELIKRGFILSEHLIGLTIVIIGALFFLSTLKGFVVNKNKMEEKLIASRICCEYERSNYWTRKVGYQLKIIPHGLVVFHHGNEVLRIKEENA